MKTQTQCPTPTGERAQDGALYPHRDHEAQGEYYMRHIDAMTREGLHSKSRIAGELAARDIAIERQHALIVQMQAAIFKHEAREFNSDHPALHAALTAANDYLGRS